MGQWRNDNAGEKVSMLNDMGFDHTDYSVVVKSHARPTGRWRWEIYRAGRKTPIDRSADMFATISEANRAGKIALQHLLKTLKIG